jgi:divalent metal cation (Fe/Co/Zn/Cd) transporter
MSSKASEVQCQICECKSNSCESCKKPELCSLKNCNSCCCDDAHTVWRRERIHRGLVIEYLSLAWMWVEVAGALIAGVIAGSFALIAFGSDSIIELASAFVVLRHLRLDDSGSRVQGERTALLTSLLLVSIVPLIGIGSTYSFFVLKNRPESSVLGIIIALGAVIIMPFLWIQKKKIGAETGCLPLSIDAVESATCFFMSVVLLGGLLLEFVFRIGWFDYGATLVILGFVAYEAKEAFEESRDRLR